MPMSRRDLLKLGLFSSAALVLPAERVARAKLSLEDRMPTSRLPKPFTLPFVVPPVLAPAHSTPTTAYYEIDQMEARVEILPGLKTTIWGYNGLAPGPTIVNHRGQKAVVRQCNLLPEVHPTERYRVWTSTHLHGSASAPQYDGYASDITRHNQWKDYRWPNLQDARTLWYHDHGVHITAENAYMGLAGMYILHDPLELSLPIPHGRYDVPLILRDAMFRKDGELIIDDNDESGIFGDVVLVNGRPWPAMEVEPRKYRFRVLNAAVARSFDLQLGSGEPLTVIGTDGGLMPHPQTVSHIRVGMGERYEIVIDFAKYKPGEKLVLRNLQPKNNIEFDNTDVVMAFRVGAEVTDRSNNSIPADLNPRSSVMALTESDARRTRKLEFERKNSSWVINGQTWSDVVNSGYRKVVANPDLHDVEVWELQNPHGGWFHPVHIHLVDFRILDRNGRPPEPWELGPKDVAYVGENEVVRVVMRFEHHEGRYMIHCHNLSHEDHDMMVQFQVGDVGDDPIHADPSKDMPFGPLWTEEEVEEALEREEDLRDELEDAAEDRSGRGPGSGVGVSVPHPGWNGGTATGRGSFVVPAGAPSVGTPTPNGSASGRPRRRAEVKAKPKSRRRRRRSRSGAERRDAPPAKRRTDSGDDKRGRDARSRRDKDARSRETTRGKDATGGKEAARTKDARRKDARSKDPRKEDDRSSSGRGEAKRRQSKARAVKRTEASLRRRERES